MTIAYLILVHADPAQLARLAGALPADSPVFVHVDARASATVYEGMTAALAARPHTAFVPRHACRWGGIGIVAATAALIRVAIASDLPFAHATLLSGADYPIKPAAEIAARLGAAPGAEHIECFPLDAPNRWSDHGPPFGAPDKMLRYHLRVRSRTWQTPWRRRLPYGLRPYGGTQWWTLTRDALAYVDDYLRTHPRLMRFARGVFIPDESLIQTILGNSPFAGRITGDPLRLAIWDRPEPPFPATLVSADFDLLAATKDLFARKFSPGVDAAIYDRIDRELR